MTQPTATVAAKAQLLERRDAPVRDTSRAPSFTRDAMRYGSAIAAAVALGIVQVFVLPRQLDVVTYGQYRFFLVYVGYVGALHLGLADGAFVRWAGGPRGTVRAECGRVLALLAGTQAIVVACALVGSAFLGPVARSQLLALALYALFANIATLSAYALQASTDFRRAGIVAVLPAATFVGMIVLAVPRTLNAVLIAQVASVAIAAAVGIASVARLRMSGTESRAPEHTTASAQHEAPAFGALVRVGAPVMGANVASSVSQFADRILVSSFAPATSLALYGFASSTMVAASAATQALSRVTLAHAARHRGHARRAVLDTVGNVIAAGFGVALTLLPFFEHLVARMLPKYVPAIGIVRALALGAPWWVALHVVLVGALQSYGLVRRQLALELAATALVLVVCGSSLALGAPLWGVAAAGSACAVVAWVAGSRFVRQSVADAASSHERSVSDMPVNAAISHDAQFAMRVLCIAGAALVATAVSSHWLVRTVAYAALAAVPTLRAARAVGASWRQ